MTTAAPPPSTAPPVLSVEELDHFVREAFPPSFAVPWQVVEVTDRGAVVRFPVRPDHARPGGTVSGPAMMTLADGAAWVATLSRIGPVALSVTSSLSISFLRRPSLDADLLGEAELLRLGRRLSVTDVRIRSAGGPLVAQATVTYSIPDDASAR